MDRLILVSQTILCWKELFHWITLSGCLWEILLHKMHLRPRNLQSNKKSSVISDLQSYHRMVSGNISLWVKSRFMERAFFPMRWKVYFKINTVFNQTFRLMEHKIIQSQKILKKIQGKRLQQTSLEAKTLKQGKFWLKPFKSSWLKEKIKWKVIKIKIFPQNKHRKMNF